MDCIGRKPEILRSTCIPMESLRAKWPAVACHEATYHTWSGVWTFFGSCVSSGPTAGGVGAGAGGGRDGPVTRAVGSLLAQWPCSSPKPCLRQTAHLLSVVHPSDSDIVTQVMTEICKWHPEALCSDLCIEYMLGLTYIAQLDAPGILLL